MYSRGRQTVISRETGEKRRRRCRSSSSRVTSGREAPTPEQKKALLQVATDLVVKVLGTNPATTHVIIEEVLPGNWAVGGKSATERTIDLNRPEAQAFNRGGAERRQEAVLLSPEKRRRRTKIVIPARSAPCFLIQALPRPQDRNTQETADTAPPP